MARPATIDDAELLDRLSAVLRDVGYEGASMAMLAEATGLKKASLYHRFPEGKAQIAREVLGYAEAFLKQHILAPLDGPGTPEQRLAAMARGIDRFYSGGRQSCLLNMLSAPRIGDGPFGVLIRNTFELWISRLAAVLTEVGFPKAKARERAERALALLQGSLVLARGMGTTRPFRCFLQRLPEELLQA